MSNLFSSPISFLILGLILVLVIIHELMRITLRFSHRLLRLPFPRSGSLRLVALLQVVVGIIATLLLRLIHNDPALDLGVGAALMFLSGIPFIKRFLKYPWKVTLFTWGVAFILQAVILPIVSMVTLALFVFLSSLLFPPQY